MEGMITTFKDKKLVEYLEPDKRYLIRFGHGLGDTLMFLPILGKIRSLYPESQIDLYVESGQEKIFESYPEKDSKEHDVVFSLDFPMAEGSNGTKQQKCCDDEVGIPWSDMEDVAKLKEEQSPLVAVHFQGTALPNSVNCPTGIAQQIWNGIIGAGLIPIECHFQHLFHNPVNEKYGFITNNVRGCKAEIKSLIGLLQRCYAFIGVASGPFVVAMAVMESRRILYLERLHKVETYTSKQIIDRMAVGNGYKEGAVEKWLKGL
jgi:hypothetical protein